MGVEACKEVEVGVERSKPSILDFEGCQRWIMGGRNY